MSMLGWCNQGDGRLDDGFRGTAEGMRVHAARNGVQDPMYQLMQTENSYLKELIREGRTAMECHPDDKPKTKQALWLKKVRDI